MDSPGRSGAKFFISFDKGFVIKSITGEEVALLHQILQPYHAVSIICMIYKYCKMSTVKQVRCHMAKMSTGQKLPSPATFALQKYSVEESFVNAIFCAIFNT